jgi:hypothetical protein
MDGDFNYIIDALNGIDTASGSRASINDRLSVSLNADGTLKGSVVASVDEWVLLTASNLHRVDDATLTMAGDQRGLLTEGRRLRLSVGTRTVYANVRTCAFSGSTSTLTLRDMTDAQGAPESLDTTPSAVSYSYITAGFDGNMPHQQPTLRLKQTEPLLRFLDNAESGIEYALRNKNGLLEVLENTGTETAPIWTVRATFGQNGLIMADGSLNLEALSDGTPNRLILRNGEGEATEGTVGGALTLSEGVLTAPLASEEEAETGTDNTKLMTPLRVAQAISALVEPAAAGKVLQVKQGTFSTQTSSTSSAYTDITNASVTLTPASTASKVLVMMELTTACVGAASTGVGLQLVRNSTAIYTRNTAQFSTTAGNEYESVTLIYLDSPNATSAITYKGQVARTNSSGTVTAPAYGGLPGSITVLEIGA